MKNSILKFIVLSIITTFAFSSCSDYLDKQPDDQLDLESVFENKKNIKLIVEIIDGLHQTDAADLKQIVRVLAAGGEAFDNA